MRDTLKRRAPFARRVRVFVAVPEQGLHPELEHALAGAIQERHELLAPPPDWLANVSQSERNRFLTVVDRMMEADLLVADVSEPSTDVGWCVAWFLARGRLAILTCRRDARPRLAPMLAGNPSPWQRLALYDTHDDLRAALAALLA